MGQPRPDILTQSGIYFNFHQPEPSMVDIEDIAHGLSHVCRFAGQCNQFYSVAEHSVYVSQVVPPHLALHGLLHDAAEAYVGDVTAPLKRLLMNYKLIEERAQKAILERFGLLECDSAEIKQADLRMLATEQAQLMPAHDDEWALIAGIKPYNKTIECMPPEQARGFFLRRFEELTNGAFS